MQAARLPLQGTSPEIDIRTLPLIRLFSEHG